jgi:hypothetical protein
VVRGASVLARCYVLSLAACSLSLASGCDNLSEFGGTFSGGIVEGSFVRACFAPDTRAELRFTPAHAVGSTADLPDKERNWLILRDESDVVFDAPLEPIYTLASDALADFDFPGQKRLRNYMLLARSSVGPLVDHEAVVVISLLATKKIELRVMARGDEEDMYCVVDSDDDATGNQTPRFPEYFGLFKLSK